TVRGFGKTPETPAEHLADTLGDTDLGDGRRPDPASLEARQGPGLDEVAHHLLDEERVPFRLAVDGDHEPGRVVTQVLPGERLEQRAYLTLGEATQEDAMIEPFASQLAEHLGERVAPIEIDVAVGPEDDETGLSEAAKEVPEQEERRAICPVQVVEHEDEWRVGGRVDEQRGDALEESMPFLLRRELHGCRSLRQTLEHLGYELRHFRCTLAELAC